MTASADSNNSTTMTMITSTTKVHSIAGLPSLLSTASLDSPHLVDIWSLTTTTITQLAVLSSFSLNNFFSSQYYLITTKTFSLSLAIHFLFLSFDDKHHFCFSFSRFSIKLKNKTSIISCNVRLLQEKRRSERVGRSAWYTLNECKRKSPCVYYTYMYIVFMQINISNTLFLL